MRTCHRPPALARALSSVFLLAGLACLAPAARAQDVVLGSSLPLTGVLESAGKSALAGMQAYLARVEREGGVAGHHVVLRTRDDRYEAARYADNVRRLFDQDHVEALVMSAGTSNIAQAYPVIAQHGRPLIGALTGASVLRGDDHPLIYHLRASYADEVRRLAEQAASVSQKNVYAVWQDDGLGRDAFAALVQAAKDRGLHLVGQQAVAIATMDGAAIAKSVREAKPDALFMLCVTPCAARILPHVAGDGSFRLQPYALSIVNGETLAGMIGAAARGTVISQVLPDPHHPTSPLVRRYQQDMRQWLGHDEFSYFSLEGYVAAMVAVEAARAMRARPALHTMDDAMRELVPREFDGVLLSAGRLHGPRPHPVTLSMIGADGRLMQ